MAKYLALRRYNAAYHTQCGASNRVGTWYYGSGFTNPTAYYSSHVNTGHPIGGTRIGQCGMDGCLAICPDCGVTIKPYKAASNGLMMTMPSGSRLPVYSGECYSLCPGAHAGGPPLSASTLAAIGAVPSSSPQPVTRQVQVPAQTHKGIAPQDPDKRVAFLLKLQERVKQGIYTALAQGHSMNQVAIVDLDSPVDTMRDKCSVCAADLVVGLREFSDPPYTGTAVAFPCKLMMKGRKP